MAMVLVDKAEQCFLHDMISSADACPGSHVRRRSTLQAHGNNVMAMCSGNQGPASMQLQIALFTLAVSLYIDKLLTRTA